MKKVLLASTALAMTAGMAAADVTLSGSAEIGVAMVDDGDGVTDDLQFHNDIDVTFTLSGETDGGVTFGATVDLDEVSDGLPSDEGPDSVFVSGDFGTITMGDTDGAFDWALSEIAWAGAIADDHTAHAGWNGNSGLDGSNDGQIARYDYSFGDFAFGASLELDDLGAADDVFGLGFKYSGDFGGTSFGVGVGYQDGGDLGDIIGVSLDAGFAGGFTGRVNFSDGEIGGADFEHIGVGVNYESGPISVDLNYGENSVADVDEDGIGAAFNYDLGGGATVMVGYGTDDTTDRFSAGLGLSF